MSIEYPINVSTPDYDMLTWQYLIGFGNRFKDFRTTDLGFTQDRMGDIMKISQSEVSRIEHGQRITNIVQLANIKRIYPQLDLNNLIDNNSPDQISST